MKEKTVPSEKERMKMDVSSTRKKCGKKEGIKTTGSGSHQRAKIRRTVKLPRLKLEDLVAQVTEENAHEEISTGSAVGNEVW